MIKEIRFSNRNQVVLYECEIKGQLSDGFWENAEPLDHWENMCEAVVKEATGNEKLGCLGFRPAIEYDFADPDLIEVVGDRMIESVKTVICFPEYYTRMGSHWSWKLTDIEQAQVDKIEYTEEDLVNDLREMSDIVNGNMVEV
jgi:hypothetical protein